MEDISCQKVYENLNDFYLIDVRTSGEFEDGHIENSNLCDCQTIVENKKELLEKSKGKKIVFICRSGGRATMCMSMVNLEDSYNLEGGISEWEDLDYPLVESTGKCSLK